MGFLLNIVITVEMLAQQEVQVQQGGHSGHCSHVQQMTEGCRCCCQRFRHRQQLCPYYQKQD